MKVPYVLRAHQVFEKMTDLQVPEPKARLVGGTEYSWCKAVQGGTGITVLALLLSKPLDLGLLQNALHHLQNSFPILRSKLCFDAAANSFSFVTPATSHLRIKSLDLSSTLRVLQLRQGSSLSDFHRIVEHELNQSAWRDPTHPLYADADVLFASLYELTDTQRALVLRVHTAACDRTSAVAVLSELVWLVSRNGVGRDIDRDDGVSLGIEDLVPRGKASKPFWSRGMDLLGYSLNSFRHSHIDFMDADSPRSSQFVRLQLNHKDTQRLLDGCKLRRIKLCGALLAAGLIAAHSSKDTIDGQREKYAVVTLADCRSILEPPPHSYHLGFYHSAILNTHDVGDGDDFWELATRTYKTFENAKNNNKHLTDMGDLNLLMCKAIENPGMTASSSLRTSYISVFEDPVMDNESKEMHQEIGLDDFIGCSSVHGVGPSIALFDTIRDGWLDCTCLYPSPLHSRDQMLGLIDHMKRILVDDNNYP